MHSLLESYLSEVSAHLGALPPKRRTEELREMRAHLENAMAVSREMGRTEADAAAHAVEQFGTARDLGENLAWAWRRGEGKQKWSLVGAAGSNFVMRFLVPACLFPLETAYFHPTGPGHIDEPVLASLCFNLAGPVSAGAVSGFLFPKRAMEGAWIAAAGFLCLALAIAGYWLTHHGLMVFPVSTSTVVLGVTVQSVSSGIVSLLSAWAGRRWRNARTGQARAGQARAGQARTGQARAARV